MNKTIINEYRPVNFNEYLGQDNHIRFAKNLISKNLHSRMRSLLITGKPGTGKSTLASLIAKTTLCINRKEGEYEPCGECNVCTGKNTSNITHYTITSATKAREDLDRITQISYQQPVKITNRPDQFRRFIILDEVELMTPELVAVLLDPLEHSPATTSWILISMDIDKLQKSNEAIKKAIEGRCVSLALSPLSIEQISEGLTRSYPSLDKSAALVIADISKGDMREAWNILAYLSTIHSIEELDGSTIYEYYLGGASIDSRQEMWRALARKDGVLVKSIIDRWLDKVSDPKYVADLLQKDLINSLTTYKPQVQELLTSLSRWYSSSHRYSLTSVFMGAMSVDIGDIMINNPVDNSIGLKVKEQMLKALANSKPIPEVFKTKSFEDYLSVYKSHVLHN